MHWEGRDGRRRAVRGGAGRGRAAEWDEQEWRREGIVGAEEERKGEINGRERQAAMGDKL